MTDTANPKKSKPKFKVVPWKDLHGTAAFHLVVDSDGHQCGIPFPSEREALAAAKKLAAAQS